MNEYIAIDPEKMVVLRKIDNTMGTLSKLMEIEFSHCPVKIIPSDMVVFFKCFTDLELKWLIKNSNGPDVVNIFDREVLLRCAHATIAEIPMQTAKAFEVDMQRRAIHPDDKRHYEFVPGSTVPRAQDKFPDVVPLKRTGGPMAVPASVQTAAPIAAQATAVQALPAHTVFTATASVDFTPPKPGTSTHRIFSFCDEQWKLANCSDDKGTLSAIRKRAVETLCAEGLNVSTVRTQGIRWEQNRQRLV